jgi:hypothetical protein
MVMDTAMDTEVMAGGARLFITLHVGVGGVEVQDLMDSMEIISMPIITSMLTMRTMYTETGVVFQARVTIVPEVLLPEL